MQTKIKWTVKLEEWYGNKRGRRGKEFSIETMNCMEYGSMKSKIEYLTMFGWKWIYFTGVFFVNCFPLVPSVQTCATGKGRLLCTFSCSIVQNVKWNIFRMGLNDFPSSGFEHKTFSANWAETFIFIFHLHCHWVYIDFCVFDLILLRIFSHRIIDSQIKTL